MTEKRLGIRKITRFEGASKVQSQKLKKILRFFFCFFLMALQRIFSVFATPHGSFLGGGLLCSNRSQELVGNEKNHTAGADASAFYFKGEIKWAN